MTCQRCNISSRPTARCLVAKGLGEVEREYCRECRDYTRRTYPVTVLDEPPGDQETPQAAPQAASAPADARRGRQPLAVHMRAFDGEAVCRQTRIAKLTTQPVRVTCRRCLARM